MAECATESPALPKNAIGAGATIEDFPRWYAVYTKSRHEKQVQKQCEHRSIESFLPLYAAIHLWKNRKTRVQLPLFPSYVFIRFKLDRRLQLLQIPGVVCIVGFNGQAASLQDEEIETLQKTLYQGVCAVPHPYLVTGRRARVKVGALAGAEGIFVRRKNNVRVVLSIRLLQRSVAVDMDLKDIELLSSTSTISARQNSLCVKH